MLKASFDIAHGFALLAEEVIDLSNPLYFFFPEDIELRDLGSHQEFIEVAT